MSSPLAGEPIVGRRLTARKIQGSVVDAPTVHFPLEHHLYGKTPTGIITPTFSRAAPDAYELWNGVWYPKGTNEPRFQADSTPLGYLAEGSRVNYFLNSDAPVTQTITLGTGDFTLWLEGTGTITSSAGTATATGYGAATEGSPNTINITGAGTVVFTLSGSATIAQVENGTTKSSFILTAGSAVTRAADSASWSTSGWLNASEGTIVVEVTTGNAGTSDATIFQIDDGSGANRIMLQRLAGTGTQFFVVDGGSIQAAINNTTVITDNTTYKMAVAWDTNDFIIYLDGSPSGTPDTTGIVPTGLANFRLSVNHAPGNYGNHNTRYLDYYDYRRDNDDLARLTT